MLELINNCYIFDYIIWMLHYKGVNILNPIDTWA